MKGGNSGYGIQAVFLFIDNFKETQKVSFVQNALGKNVLL